MKKTILLTVAMLSAFSVAACNTPEDRALGGAALGAATGAVIGGAATGRVGGALAGGVIGAVAGGVIGGTTAPRRCYRRAYDYNGNLVCAEYY